MQAVRLVEEGCYVGPMTEVFGVSGLDGRHAPLLINFSKSWYVD